MKAFLLFIYLFLFCQVILAQTDSVRLLSRSDTLLLNVPNSEGVSLEQDNLIKLSDSFKKALDDAFSFSPTEAPLPKQNDLTIEQLHEWVGNPTIEETMSNVGKFNATYKELKMWEKEFYVPCPVKNSPFQINLGPMPNPNTGSVSFDFNVLGQYIRPKEIRMRRLQQKAKEHLKELDELQPILIEK